MQFLKDVVKESSEATVLAPAYTFFPKIIVLCLNHSNLAFIVKNDVH